VNLADDPVLRTRLEARARGYARTVLDPGRCAGLYVDIAAQAAS